MTANVDGDFLGAFGVVRRGETFLLVANDRQIGGRTERTWDLPGGRVEAGELLAEALSREMDEETGLQIVGSPRLLFLQEGERRRGGARLHAWRSFFFAIDVAPGEPVPGHEVLAVRWMTPVELRAELDAPYHDSFLSWLDHGGDVFRSVWDD